MTYQEQFIATKAAFDNLIAKVNSAPLTFEEVCANARQEASQKLADNDQAFPYRTYVALDRAESQARYDFRANLICEMHAFRTELARLCYVIIQDLLNTAPVSPKVASTRFGEVIRMARTSYYDDNGTRWTAPYLCTESDLDNDDSPDYDVSSSGKPLPYRLSFFKWFYTELTGDVTFSEFTPFSFMWLAENPDQDSIKALVVTRHINEVIRAEISDEFQGCIAQGTEGSTLNIGLGTSVEKALNTVFYSSVVSVLNTHFSSVR